MSRTEQNTKGRPTCLTLLVPIRTTGQQTGSQGMILPGSKWPAVSGRLNTAGGFPQNFHRNFLKQLGLKKRVHIGYTFKKQIIKT